MAGRPDPGPPKVEGKIKGVFRTSTPQGKNWTIAMEGVASDVPAKYVKALAEKGWTIGMKRDDRPGRIGSGHQGQRHSRPELHQLR